MATVYKVLGQSAPAATTATTLYTVPASTEAVISTIVVANRAGTAGTFRIAVRPDGATLANEHYIAYDAGLDGFDSFTLTIGLTLSAADAVTVFASNANFSFGLFGSEIS